MPKAAQPKVFLSYSWTSIEYTECVVQLAADLMAAGVDVVFDRYDLKEGQDKHVFMERAVSDDTIDRVLVLCDPLYEAKANGREGGVGTETLIISPEVYHDAAQEKFLPIIMETDGGEVRVPTYLEGRMYIDLSDPRTAIGHFQHLVRRLYDKPEIERPQLGPPPAYLEARNSHLRTGRALDVFKDAAIRGKPNQRPLLEDYLERLAGALTEETHPPSPTPEPLDDWAVALIDALVAYRDEFITLLQFLGRYDEDGRFSPALHRFFELLVATRYARDSSAYAEDPTSTPLTFCTWELFLYTIGVLERADRFCSLLPLFEPFHAPSRFRDTTRLHGYGVVDPGFRLLDDVRRQRLGLRFISVTGHMLRDRVPPAIPFEALIEADVLCWARGIMDPDHSERWYPRTLVYAENLEVLPLFVRLSRRSLFDRFSPVLWVRDREQLVERWEGLNNSSFPEIGHFWGGKNRYARLLNIERLGTRG